MKDEMKKLVGCLNDSGVTSQNYKELTPTWISVKERLPEYDCLCLVCSSKGYMYNIMALYQSRDQVWTYYCPASRETLLLDVTHYLVIPPPPEQEVPHA